MLMAIILLVLYQIVKNNQKHVSDIGAQSIIIWNIWSFVMVEVLSSIKLLTRQMIFICWGIFDSVLFLLLIGTAKSICSWPQIRYKMKENIRKISLLKWYHMILIIMGLIVLVLALFTVPYNWDSMTYHLPRIAQWVQNRSVSHYAANDVRQLASPVLAEFINLQVYLYLDRRDFLFNMLQAVSYLADAWFIYVISRKIGVNDKISALSVFLFMTMPIAFGEALNTQVDLFATLWFLIFISYFIDLFEAQSIKADKGTIIKVILMALCVSLGYLSKPSVNIGMALLLLFLFVKCFYRHDKWNELIKLFLIALPFVFLLLLPEGIRNYQTFLRLSDPAVGARQLIGTLRPNYVIVNLIKNFAHNLPNIYCYNSEEIIVKIISYVAVMMGVELNNPTISEDGLEYVLKKSPVYGHDTATNPVILILAFVCFIICLTHINKRNSVGNRYSIYSMVIFVVFCGVVRWEPYVVRYMLPYLAILCPMVGYQLYEMEFGNRKYVGKAFETIAYFLCITTLCSLVLYHCECIPQKGQERVSGYFVNARGMYPEYAWVFSTLKEDGCHTMGLKVSSLNFEYPMWKLSKYTMDRIENVLVENVSSKYEDMTFIPDCVIMDKRFASEEMVIHGQKYYVPEKFQSNESLAVLYKE